MNMVVVPVSQAVCAVDISIILARYCAPQTSQEALRCWRTIRAHTVRMQYLLVALCNTHSLQALLRNIRRHCNGRVDHLSSRALPVSVADVEAQTIAHAERREPPEAHEFAKPFIATTLTFADEEFGRREVEGVQEDVHIVELACTRLTLTTVHEQAAVKVAIFVLCCPCCWLTAALVDIIHCLSSVRKASCKSAAEGVRVDLTVHEAQLRTFHVSLCYVHSAYACAERARHAQQLAEQRRCAPGATL